MATDFGPEFPHAKPYPAEQSTLMEPPPASGQPPAVHIEVTIPTEEPDPEPARDPETILVPVPVPVLAPMPTGASNDDESDPDPEGSAQVCWSDKLERSCMARAPVSPSAHAQT